MVRWPGGTTSGFAGGAGLVPGALVAGAWAVFGDDGSASSWSSTCDVTGVADRVLLLVVTLQVSGSQGSGTGLGGRSNTSSLR